MAKPWKSLGAVMLCLGLSACSLFSSEEDVVVMAEVPEFESSIQVMKQWEGRVGKGVKGYFSTLSPVVAYDQVYAAARFGEVSAFSLEGKKQWSVDLSKLDSNTQFSKNTNNARISGGLTAAYQRIYLGTENADVIALDAKTGELIWQAKVSGEVVSSPAVGDSLVVVVTSDGKVISLDAHTGEEKWSTVIDQPTLMLRSKAAPIISNGAVILGRPDGKVGVYLLNSGQLVYELRLAQARGSTEIDRIVDVSGTPVLVGAQMYAVAYNGNLVSMNLQTGEEAWKRRYSSYRDLVLSGAELFVSDSEDTVYSIARRDGAEAWSQNELSYRRITTPAVDGNSILVGDSEGYLYWLDRESGAFKHKLLVDDDGLYVAPVVTDNSVIIQTRSGKIIALDRS